MTLKSIFFSLSILFTCLITYSVTGQNTVGGHFGFVQPIVTIQDGDTTNGFDPYTIGFPTGVTIRKSEKFAFDIEFVPFISAATAADGGTISSVSELLIHPGLLWGIGDKLTFGNRLAYETKSGRFGITPLLNKGFLLGKTNVFAEFVFPIRVGNDQDISLTAALHFGVGF
ncbi:hypothetical protein [Aquimarina agarilytica]|uniref:hypothetical protein n=1 Tax=Aquimarina agarilytica TaxID=1087449 RepID=UPI0002893FF4|nr:hypothetical protein [Aquimarina agarilytica]